MIQKRSNSGRAFARPEFDPLSERYYDALLRSLLRLLVQSTNKYRRSDTSTRENNLPLRQDELAQGRAGVGVRIEKGDEKKQYNLRLNSQNAFHLKKSRRSVE
jgi:hypothetical protein